MRTSFEKRGTIQHPSLGAWVQHQCGRQNPTLPGHVIVGDLSGPRPRYLDAFDGWQERTPDQLREIVRATSGLALHPDHLEPAPARALIRRMLVNLTGSYMRRELYTEARWTVELQAIVHPDDPGVAEQLRAFDRLR